jgi:crotonobetainyl-CoA:carnitine CoA-transferase CaiB-like acyl-CoA transferase
MASAQQPAAPLAGVTVVALEQAVSAPMCTRALADFGARVIKVENPAGGDFARHYDDVVNGPGGLAAHFVWANRNKESVALDLKAPEGIDILHRLLDRADVLVSNLAPGSTARLGISPDQLRDRHPEVIAVEIDGYGAGGPLSHKRAYDLLAQSESGSCAVTGYPGKPAKPGPPIADISTGLYSALSIMALLYSRDDRPRRGAVNVSLFDTMMDLMGYPLTYTQHSGVDQQPLGMSSPAVAPYGAYRTADGQTVVLGTTNDRSGSGWPARSSNARTSPTTRGSPPTPTGWPTARSSTRPSAGAAGMISWRSRRSPMPRASAMPVQPAQRGARASAVEHRDRWRTVQTAAGPIRAILPPPIIEGYEQPMGPVPGLGEHTDAVLAELGLSGNEIGRLRERGVVA